MSRGYKVLYRAHSGRLAVGHQGVQRGTRLRRHMKGVQKVQRRMAMSKLTRNNRRFYLPNAARKLVQFLLLTRTAL